ncbi:MAG: Crp/Fnr family transcriptional regulator [Actinobacteria bacterium]|nr:Crp/Fnr family transcriptional regulator [Actinomycetota bacterium]
MALRAAAPPFAGFAPGVRSGGLAWLERELRRSSPVPLPSRAIEELCAAVEEVTLRAGETLYAKHERPSGVWIIRAGAVELFDSNGKNRYVVSVLRIGDFVGDLHLLVGAESPFTAKAVERTLAFFVPRGDFERIVHSYPALGLAWSSQCARRLARTRTRIFEILVKDPFQRLARLLVEESVGNRVRLPQKTFAQMLGMSRTSVNRALKTLERRGVISLSYAAVQIVDRDALQAIAHEGLDRAA